jgi:hypothetical protein
MSICISTLQKLSQYKQYSKRALNLNEVFHMKENKGGGDCLFRSMAQNIYDDESRHRAIRRDICNYYKKFDMQASYPENSLEYKLQITLICEEFDSNGLRIDETTGECISKQNVWGGTAEILVMAILYRLNIIVVSAFDDKRYSVIPYRGDSRKAPIFLYYNGENHYQSLTPNRRVSSRISKNNKNNKNNKRKNKK